MKLSAIRSAIALLAGTAGAGAQWSVGFHEDTLTAWITRPNAKVGRSVAGDGRSALVGAPAEDEANLALAGAVYAFRFEQHLDAIEVPSAYQWVGTVFPPPNYSFTWVPSQRLVPQDPAGGGAFGSALALDGDTLLVGSPRGYTERGVRTGAVYIFSLVPGRWVQVQKLESPDGADDDEFGCAVAIEGDTALVGARLHDAGASDAGAVYVYRRAGAGAWQFHKKLVSAHPQATAWFGFSVGVDAPFAVVGVPHDRTSATNWSGTVRVFSTLDWFEKTRLQQASPAGQDFFGFSIGADGGRILVGAPGAAPPAGRPYDGAVYEYAYDAASSQWRLVATAGDPHSSPKPGWLGWSVALNGSRGAAGAPRSLRGVYQDGQWRTVVTGRAYIVPGGGALAEVKPPEVSPDMAYGWSVAVHAESSGFLIVGAPGHKVKMDEKAGAAFAFGGLTCFIDCDHSTSPPVIDYRDIQCFFRAFIEGDPAANCDQSSSVNILDAVCFISGYAAVQAGWRCGQ